MAGSSFNPRPQTIEAVVDYILKKLGVQLLEINVTEQQLLDRISDAIVYFQEHHADGTFKAYIKTKIEATKFLVNDSISDNATLKDCIQAAAWRANIYSITDSNVSGKKWLSIYNFKIYNPSVVPVNNETITINEIEYIISNVVLGPDTNGGYINLPTNVESIVEILPMSNGFLANNGQIIVDYSLSINYTPYSSYLNQFFQYAGSSTSLSFGLQQMRQGTLDWLRNLNPWADFNRLINRVYLNNYNFANNIGSWVVMEVLCATDPESYPEMYGDTWFLRYATELVRRQWGENLGKFEEVKLLNGLTVNGSKMAEKAQTEIDKLEVEMWERYRTPDDFFLA